ncbi:Uncharacterized protein Adt_31963 [Abeliophyllum distichum]|uniref:Thionin-like protein 2 n=1 Tax=Abeliophyllum distichum TaxID=126358 RepID=A0ABD1RH13_9LAMI
MGRNVIIDVSEILVIVIVVVTMVASGVSGQSIYACWGGCENECFLLSGKSSSERYPCFLQCVQTCVPTIATANADADDDGRFCATGCLLELCIPSTSGAKKDECFQRCTNICKI